MSHEIRIHNTDAMVGLAELEHVTDDFAVVVRADGSLDVYGYVPIVDQRPVPGLGDELFPEGRNVWYEGDDPEGFLAAVRERWGLELTLKQDPSGYAFFCPPGYVDAIVYESEWPMGT
jgi:hypothetical protein